MKHLKTYNEGKESLVEITNDLEDICLELQDEGFLIRVDHPGKDSYMKAFHPEFQIRVSIEHKRGFKFNQISEVVERIIEYSTQCGYLSIINILDAINISFKVYFNI